jgi:hypothetical protein
MDQKHGLDAEKERKRKKDTNLIGSAVLNWAYVRFNIHLPEDGSRAIFHNVVFILSRVRGA